uniref:Uncharacterized protein n=1 Tax=Arundo donax TaxID=35708 RepID=A0A0A9HIC1_ARUDO
MRAMNLNSPKGLRETLVVEATAGRSSLVAGGRGYHPSDWREL